MLLFVAIILVVCDSFSLQHLNVIKGRVKPLSMIIDSSSIVDITDHLNSLPQWAEFASQGFAATDVPVVCPDFGQPGWGPFCFLNGNPVFKAFDSFQEFVQNSVVTISF